MQWLIGAMILKIMKQRALFCTFLSGAVVLPMRQKDGGNNGIVKAVRNVLEMQGIVCVDEYTARKLGTCKNRRYEANEPYCRDWVLSVVLSSH